MKIGDLVTTNITCGIKLVFGIVIGEGDPIEWDDDPLFFVWWFEEQEFNTCPWKPEQLKLISNGN